MTPPQAEAQLLIDVLHNNIVDLNDADRLDLAFDLMVELMHVVLSAGGDPADMADAALVEFQIERDSENDTPQD
jgi:hypothetical protein